MAATTVSVKPAVINHMVKAAMALVPAAYLFMGAIEAALGYSANPDADRSFQIVVPIVFGIPALLLALAGSRNVIALFSKPEMVLSPEGLRLRYWNGTGFLGLFLPKYRVRSYMTPWNRVTEVKTVTHKVNSILVNMELRIQRPDGVMAFGWDVFSPGVEDIQSLILDYMDDLFRGPERESARLPDFQVRRWAEPLVLSLGAMPIWTPLALFAAAAGCWCGGVVWDIADNLYGPVALGCVILGLMAAKRWWNERKSKRVELRSDGLALGPSESALTLVPWADIQLARPHTLSSYWGGTKELAAIEVRLRSGKSVLIRSPEKGNLSRLLGLLEPPLDKLAAAQARIARGEGAEAAARAVGLPGR